MDITPDIGIIKRHGRGGNLRNVLSKQTPVRPITQKLIRQPYSGIQQFIQAMSQAAKHRPAAQIDQMKISV